MIEKSKKKIYLDHAATTPVDKDVLEKMLPYFSDVYGNSNSQHSFGQETGYIVDTARRNIASLLGVKHNELYFTSGGTEADNWAVKGINALNTNPNGNIIVSSIEHHAILSACSQVEKAGRKVIYINPDINGVIQPKTLEKEITSDTFLVIVMTANNETGTIQPIKELCEISHNYGAYFMTDAVQAIGNIPFNIPEVNPDLLSISAHKFYGPKGIGALYIKGGIKIDKLISGGAQEYGLRGGTTNTPLIVGFSEALSNALANIQTNFQHIDHLSNAFVKKVLAEIPYVNFNGGNAKKLPGIINLSFEFVEATQILNNLDRYGIACSAGSACTSGSVNPSHVLINMGLPKDSAKSAIRFSFGKHNTLDEINIVVDLLKSTVEKLRETSTLFAEIKGIPESV